MISLRVKNIRGVTVLELAVVVVIILILATMLLPISAGIRARADEASCAANLKNLYIGASAYLDSKGSWPQISNSLIKADPQTYAQQWVAALLPFGITHVTWICPSIQRLRGEPISGIDDPSTYRVDYIGMAFDEKQTSPKPANPFPWFIEIAGMHDRGNLIILSNGTMSSLSDMSH